MGDGHHRALVIGEETFEPGHGFRVQVIGGLVQKQQIGPAQQQPAERHPAPFAARQGGHVGARRRAAQRLHGDLHPALQLPAVHRLDLLLNFPL